MKCELCKGELKANKHMTINDMEKDNMVRHYLICNSCRKEVLRLLWKLKEN